MRSSALLLLALLVGAFLVPSPASAQADAEAYRLRASRLEGSLAAGENVYTAIKPILTHGTTTVIGDSALVYREREFVIFRGNVKIVDGSTTMWGDQATYDRRERLATLKGNVRIQEDGSRITGREAYFYRSRNLSVITGSPRLVDSTRTLTADRIEYDRNTDVVLALGHVDAIDKAESTRVTAGRVRYDRRADYAWADLLPSLELTEPNGLVTHVQGDTLEFDNARNRVFARGNVIIRREELQATAGRAAFYRSENRALLVESPRARDPEGSASGDTLEIYFVRNRVASIQARPNAHVAYEAKADSGRAARTTASGDTITLFLEKEQARRAVIVGHASSSYWPSSADSARGGRNESSGDTIVVEFEGGKPTRATVLGASRGTYHMVAEGDTTGAEARERILYSGERIVYDLRGNTVDVLGTADVAYREMRLSARQVHFDATTEKMRAEGNPVLQDRGDRIVGETMTYDLSIQRGSVLAGRTQYEQGFVTGRRVLRLTNEILEVESGTYTTCDLAEPHFHFSSDKMKIILHDKVIAKPIVFYIKRIPVLALPFYVFPIRTERHSGFQLPHLEIGSSTASGKFVRNVGYYWAINDHLDATFFGDYYQDREWIAHGQTRYHKRYHYQGEVSGSYDNQFQLGSNRWDLVGRHYQILGRDFTVSAQANLTNSSTYRKDLELGNSVLTRVQRNLRSFVGLDKHWSGLAVNAALERNEDLDPDPGGLRVQQTAPRASFSVSSRPIGRVGRAGVPSRLPWLASTVYSLRSDLISEHKDFERATRTVVVTDSAGAPIDTLAVPIDSTFSGTAMLHSVSLTDNRKLGFLRVSENVSASGIYYSRDLAGDRDRFGGVWRAGVGANAQIFGTMSRPIGPLRALRHVITPEVGFRYQPQIRNITFVDTAGVRRPRFGSIGGLGLGSSEERFLSFRLTNNIHVKWGAPDRPRTLNNLIQLSTSGTYDFLARRRGGRPLSDLVSSLRLQPIERSAFDFTFVHDPYTGTLRSLGASTAFQLQGSSRAAEDSIQQMTDEPGEAAVREGNYLRTQGLTPSNLPWLFGFSIGYAGNRNLTAGSPTYGRWSYRATLNPSLGINLSKNWRLDYAAQYDMRSRLLVSQNFTVKRELHCWEAQFVRSISGEIKEYYFKINVKLLPEVYYEQGSRGLRGFGGFQNPY